jgi:hypothetical protein
MHAGSERWARRDRTALALTQSSMKPCCRQNAIPFTCERSVPKGQGAHPARSAGRGSTAMPSIILALVRCYG